MPRLDCPSVSAETFGIFIAVVCGCTGHRTIRESVAEGMVRVRGLEASQGLGFRGVILG